MSKCSFCKKEVIKENSYKGYCSESCWDADWSDRPRGGAAVFYGGESPGTKKDPGSREEPYDEHNRGCR